jgi:PAS domain S-box-containing protein
MRTRGTAIERAPDGRPLRVVGCTTDVHERRVAEERLAESELRFRTASQLGHEHIAELAVEADGGLRLLWSSDGLPAALGCSADQFAVHCGSGRFVHPDELQRFLDIRSDVLSGSSREFATRLIGLDGRIVPVKMVCQPTALRSDGRVARLLSTVLELPGGTDGAGVESPSSGLAALQQTVLEYVPACLVLLDADRRIRFANRSLQQHLPDAVVGRELEDCFQPQWRQIVRAAINRSRDERRNVEVEGIAPAAARLAGRSYRLHVAPASSRGAFEGWCVVVRDVTQARNAEADAFHAIGHDAQQIGHELHDGVGQQLTGAVLLMQSLASELAAEGHRLAPEAEQVQGLMSQSIDDVRMLARSLSPVGTAPTGLPAAMQSLATRARSIGRLVVDLKVAVEPGHSLSAVEGDHLYWIAQEAVTNAIRHAAATRLELSLEVSGDRFWLRVRDDGRGFAAVRDSAAGSGSGITLMTHRARGLGATFTLTPDPPGGTLVTCARAGRG